MRKFKFYFFRRQHLQPHVLLLAICSECLGTICCESPQLLYDSIAGHNCAGYVIPLDFDSSILGEVRKQGAFIEP